MKYIKGVHRHGSETFLIISKDQESLKTKSIIKSATTQKGINSITSEHKGINWYNSQTSKKIKCYFRKTNKNLH